jgi:hemerythrin superfamily protein
MEMVMATSKKRNGSTGTWMPKRRSNRRMTVPPTEAPDAITLLKTDHREVEKLFAQFEKTSGAARKQPIVKKICDALTVHATIEEEIFYPQAREALKRSGQDLLDEAEVEHEGIKWRIEELKRAKPEAAFYDARVKVLSEYVKHHVHEEEHKLFPKVRASDLDTAAVGSELAARKEALTGKPVKVEPSLIEKGMRALAGPTGLYPA